MATKKPTKKDFYRLAASEVSKEPKDCHPAIREWLHESTLDSLRATQPTALMRICGKKKP